MTVHYTGFYVTGEESYTGDNMSKMVLSLVDYANQALPKWQQIRMDGNGAAYAHQCEHEIYFDDDADVWAWNNGPKKYALLTKFPSKLCAYDTFGIIRTDTETQDAPERTIADTVTIADNRLTVAHVRAIADLHPTAQAYMVKAIADGKIMLQ